MGRWRLGQILTDFDGPRSSSNMIKTAELPCYSGLYGVKYEDKYNICFFSIKNKNKE